MDGDRDLKKPATVEDAEAALLRIKEDQKYHGDDVDLILGVLKRLTRAVEHASHAEYEKRQMLGIVKGLFKDE